jgi:O-succinylbenzoate synthase
LAAPPSAWLLPAGAAVLPALEEALATKAQTLKWKVAAGHDVLERQMLEVVLERLPEGVRLRLDANGGWDRATAAAWAERLAGEPRLEWLEQPLADDDLEGLEALADRLPVALDESLWRHPWLRQRWSGWQVRRPALWGGGWWSTPPPCSGAVRPPQPPAWRPSGGPPAPCSTLIPPLPGRLWRRRGRESGR